MDVEIPKGDFDTAGPCWLSVGDGEWRCRECGHRVHRGSYPTHLGHAPTCSYSAAPIIERAEKAEAEIDRLTRERDEALERIGRLQLVGSRIASERDRLRTALPAAEAAKRWHNALSRLVALKEYKDAHGKDEYYEAEQPEAWSQAKRALGEPAMIDHQTLTRHGGCDYCGPHDPKEDCGCNCHLVEAKEGRR